MMRSGWEAAALRRQGARCANMTVRARVCTFFIRLSRDCVRSFACFAYLVILVIIISVCVSSAEMTINRLGLKHLSQVFRVCECARCYALLFGLGFKRARLWLNPPCLSIIVTWLRKYQHRIGNLSRFTHLRTSMQSSWNRHSVRTCKHSACL